MDDPVDLKPLVSSRSAVIAAFPFDPAFATLWTLTNGEKLTSCDIAFVPIGVKATMRNARLLYARTFPMGDEALEWAAEERQKMLGIGWRPIEAVSTAS